MVLFAAFMMWAYTWTEYVVPGRKTSVWRPLWDSVNYSEDLPHVQGLTCLNVPQRILLSRLSGLLSIISMHCEASLKLGRHEANRIHASTITGQGKPVRQALGGRWILVPRLGYTSPAQRPTGSWRLTESGKHTRVTTKQSG